MVKRRLQRVNKERNIKTNNCTLFSDLENPYLDIKFDNEDKKSNFEF